jgi:hypothetical protein
MSSSSTQNSNTTTNIKAHAKYVVDAVTGNNFETLSRKHRKMFVKKWINTEESKWREEIPRSTPNRLGLLQEIKKLDPSAHEAVLSYISIQC